MPPATDDLAGAGACPLSFKIWLKNLLHFSLLLGLKRKYFLYTQFYLGPLRVPSELLKPSKQQKWTYS